MQVVCEGKPSQQGFLRLGSLGRTPPLEANRVLKYGQLQVWVMSLFADSFSEWPTWTWIGLVKKSLAKERSSFGHLGFPSSH